MVQMSHWQLPCTHFYLKNVIAEKKEKMEAFIILNRRKPITIKDNCWLASNVVVCGGVTIGEGCVIGAGSVVTRDIPPYSLAAEIHAGLFAK